MSSAILARIIKLEERRRPVLDLELERREVADWAAANPEEASALISQVSAHLLGEDNEPSPYFVPPEPAAVRAFFMEGI